MKVLGKTKTEKDFIEIFLSEILSITAGVIAGIFLAGITEKIELIAGLFILFPGLLEMHGNIYGSLSARFGNFLLLGNLNNKYKLKSFVKENVFASIFLILIVSFFLGLTAYLFTFFVFGVENKIIILVSVLSSFISSIIEIPLTIYTTLWLFKHNLDPEDIMGPYVTSIGDIISILSIVIMVGVLI